MFTVDVASLGPGLHTLSLEPGADDLALDSDMFSDIRVDARLDVAERRILVVLDVRAIATLECDRTLRLFDQKISGSHHVLFAPPDFAPTRENEVDDIRALTPADQKIDLTDIVHDTILLAVPQRRVAPGAEEVDIQMEFGVPDESGDAVDPRWRVLKQLRSGADSN